MGEDFLAMLERHRENAVTVGLFAGWALSSTFYGLLETVKLTCKSRRLRIAGFVGVTGIIGILNLVVIKWA